MAVQLHRSPPRKNTRFSYSFLKVALLKSRAGRVFKDERQVSAELDRLVQMLSHNQRCHICKATPASAIHHIITRGNPLLRYELANLLPICSWCHQAIHDGKINQEDYINPTRWQWLQENKNKSFKDYLLGLGLTKQEYESQCKKKIKSLLR